MAKTIKVIDKEGEPKEKLDVEISDVVTSVQKTTMEDIDREIAQVDTRIASENEIRDSWVALKDQVQDELNKLPNR